MSKEYRVEYKNLYCNNKMKFKFDVASFGIGIGAAFLLAIILLVIIKLFLKGQQETCFDSFINCIPNALYGDTMREIHNTNKNTMRTIRNTNKNTTLTNDRISVPAGYDTDDFMYNNIARKYSAYGPTFMQPISYMHANKEDTIRRPNRQTRGTKLMFDDDAIKHGHIRTGPFRAVPLSR